MKAYVIKNKDGKYLDVCSSDYSHYWTSIDFAHYFRYLTNHDPKQEAEDFKNRKYPDCEVVEITIAEGDLENKLAITEKALELCERHHIRFEESTVKEQIDWRETRIKENIEYFKTKAKEMLDNESK